jgi:hypothetical protein
MNIKTGEVEVPSFDFHYGILGAMEASVTRKLPVQLALYHVYLKIVHSGMTVQEVLALPDGEFGQFVGEALQFTCDAGLFPYEKDFIPALSLSFSEGLTLAAYGTEDLVRHAHFLLSNTQNDSSCVFRIGRAGRARRDPCAGGPFATSGPSRSASP